MLRAALVSLCRLLLRIFFRRIEVVGRHHLPTDGSLLFTLNHPSGLIDPLFILCLSERRVSFLAKEPLFRMPVIGTFVKAFESLPVYRTADGADPAKNKAMMRAASELLARGNALALFPEGTSHSDPTLKRFRSGAARIALSARALGDRPVRIVPCALYYERKQTFRSRAVLAFGEALEVPIVSLDEAGDSPIAVGQELTSRLETAVHAIMPTAESAEGLVLAEKAERVFSAALRDTPDQCPRARLYVDGAPAAPYLSLAERMSRRRRLIDAYGHLNEKHPEQVAPLIERIQLLSADLEIANLAIDAPRNTHPARSEQRLALILSSLLLLIPGLAGAVIHAPAYHLIRFVAFRVSGQLADVTATAKLVSGLLFFPLTWVAVGAAGASFLGSPSGWLLALSGPPLGWTAIRFNELSGALRRQAAARRRAHAPGLNWDEITARRAKIAEEMAVLLQDA